MKRTATVGDCRRALVRAIPYLLLCARTAVAGASVRGMHNPECRSHRLPRGCSDTDCDLQLLDLNEIRRCCCLVGAPSWARMSHVECPAQREALSPARPEMAVAVKKKDAYERSAQV